MSGFAKCVIWLIALALLAHPLGQALPRRWFDGERFPYRCYKWEKQGRIYTRIGVERWKTLVPDMSRLLGDMVKKQLAPDGKTDYALLVQETCVAECVHFCLGLLSLGAFALCRSGWMVCIVAVYILLGNLPFQIIQRYNRPRLLRLMRKARKEK